MRKKVGRVVRAMTPVAIAGVVAFGLLQFVPYGWNHANPPVTGAPPWPTPESEQLARSACYDCHSNETEWPAYSYVAPMSWLVRYDVDRGREAMNLSNWGADAEDAHDAAKAVEDGSMPPDRYVRLHPDARLSAEERQVLIDALDAMDDRGGDGNRGPGGGGDGGNSGPRERQQRV
ncbi:MAG: hypothetical protein QOD63_2569 [Actinomycetota bacterium]|nr:hypothetical protein [Actinomycetota bacterium]